MITVDSHQHLWDPVELRLPDPPPEASVLGRAFLPDDLRRETVPVGVDYTVLVQGYPQSVGCNRWLFRQANSVDFIAGVVAWADLMEPRLLGARLDGLQAEPKFAGIRHIVEDEPDLDWLVREPVLESLSQLAERSIPFDMLVRPRHLRNVLKVLDVVPGLRTVVDHIAKPDIAGGSSENWARDIAAIAQHPRIHCKLSGMVTETDRASWVPSDLEPYVEHVVKVFGWDRVMFGSDWPVCLLAGDYRRVWESLNHVLRSIGNEERAKVFGSNAVEFYGLRV